MHVIDNCKKTKRKIIISLKHTKKDLIGRIIDGQHVKFRPTQNTKDYHSLSIKYVFFFEYSALIYHYCDYDSNHCRHYWYYLY